MSRTPTKERANEIAKSLIDNYQKRFKQELEGENEEFLDRVVRQYRAKVARHSWKASQKWSKWTEDGPVLMPDYTRIYYRKGETEVILQEYPPQVRLLRFNGALAGRTASDAHITEADAAKIHHYSVALPYVVFVFKFVKGTFKELRCAFSDRPLKRLEETPLRPYLSNIDSNLKLCLGTSFDESKLETGNLTQQAAYVISYFWSSHYTDEWSAHYWDNRSHFQTCDPRMASMEAWQEASTDNPLFVVEDVNWLKQSDDNFGDLIVRLFEDDKNNSQYTEELYKSLVEHFLDEVKKTFSENIDSVVEKMAEKSAEQMAEEMLAHLAGKE